jgi:hypothetical protein
MPPKLTDDQFRDLIEEYGIYFDGPIHKSSWPAQYADIFQKIKDISRSEFDDRGTTHDERGPSLRSRASKLSKVAYSCRKRRENEATWRLHTEPLVVSRFGTEFVW